MKLYHFYFIASLSLIVLSGCTLGPDYRQPELELTNEWSNAQKQLIEESNAEFWWHTFDDEQLNSLIAQSDANNLELHIALGRIEQSRALRAYASGENMPSVDAVGSYTRSRSSGNSIAAVPGEHSIYSTGFDAFWEADVFGRIKRSIESAQATLEQSIADYDSLKVSLRAEVARNYIELRTAQARIERAKENIEIQKQALELTQNRFEADVAPKLDVAQARLNLANTQSEIPSLRISETEAINRLAVLIGKSPNALRKQLLISKPLPQLNNEPAAGLPAELLRRRPDISSAERALAAQTALIGQAEAMRYPSFSLKGMLGFEATHISDLGNWDSKTFSFGPAVRWNIFDGNRLRSLVAVEEARTKQLASKYEATVLSAVEEVENAMVGYLQEKRRARALARSVDAATQSVDMVETLYKNGLTNFQNVLDAQRSLSQQQDRLAVSQGLILQKTIALYKAIGGGWQLEITDKQNEN